MRGRIAAAVLATLASWLALASMAFLWVLGFWLVYPWPDRLWMWARYAIEAPPNAIVYRWLIISGIVAALPLVAIGVAGDRLEDAQAARRRSLRENGLGDPGADAGRRPLD